MKKLSTLLLGLSICSLGFGQAVLDNAIIPLTVNINSILRLNVTSGGAIEFNVSTMNHFNFGIANSSRYTTEFTVASSIDFDVIMYAEDNALHGTQAGTSAGDYTGANAMRLDLIGYVVECTGTGVVGVGAAGDNYSLLGAADDPADIALLTNINTHEIVTSTPADGTAVGGAGDTGQNKFEVQWELATAAVTGHASNSSTNNLLQESVTPDRYTTNIFLTLVAH